VRSLEEAGYYLYSFHQKLILLYVIQCANDDCLFSVFPESIGFTASIDPLSQLDYAEAQSKLPFIFY